MNWRKVISQLNKFLPEICGILFLLAIISWRFILPTISVWNNSTIWTELFVSNPVVWLIVFIVFCYYIICYTSGHREWSRYGAYVFCLLFLIWAMGIFFSVPCKGGGVGINHTVQHDCSCIGIELDSIIAGWRDVIFSQCLGFVPKQECYIDGIRGTQSHYNVNCSDQEQLDRLNDILKSDRQGFNSFVVDNCSLCDSTCNLLKMVTEDFVQIGNHCLCYCVKQ
jgi:hypothetical protein